MASEAAINVVIWMCAAIAIGGAVLGALSYCWHRNTREASRIHHAQTQAMLGAEIDAVLRCVEEPEPPPDKVITGLMPPRG